MKVRFLQRRLSVSASRMTVRTHVPFWLKFAVGCVAFAAAVVLGIALSRTGLAQTLLGDPHPEIGRLGNENAALREERDRLLESSNTIDSRRAMEGSTIKELGDQIARLETDNARLKEDVAFFEAATADRTSANAKDAGGIAIRRFQVIQDPATHTARYRILLTQDSKANRDFTGDLQLALTLRQGGKAVNIVLPDAAGKGLGMQVARGSTNAPQGPSAVIFRSYKRIEGSLELPADAVLRSVQARILERGAIRAQQTVVLD